MVQNWHSPASETPPPSPFMAYAIKNLHIFWETFPDFHKLQNCQLKAPFGLQNWPTVSWLTSALVCPPFFWHKLENSKNPIISNSHFQIQTFSRGKITPRADSCKRWRYGATIFAIDPDYSSWAVLLQEAGKGGYDFFGPKDRCFGQTLHNPSSSGWSIRAIMVTYVLFNSLLIFFLICLP